jgi:hypothetical protein
MWIQDPESGMKKIRILDGKNSDPGWDKFWIRDKHPGPATLKSSLIRIFYRIRTFFTHLYCSSKLLVGFVNIIHF